MANSLNKLNVQTPLLNIFKCVNASWASYMLYASLCTLLYAYIHIHSYIHTYLCTYVHSRRYKNYSLRHV